jgi:glycine oxidase
LNDQQKNDCLIIGGGALGLSLAYELAGHGVAVELIDKNQVGHEASWAGAGLLPPATIAGAIEPQEKLRALSHQLHPQWAKQLFEETGIDNQYERCGGVYLARKPGEAASLISAVHQWREEQVEVQSISGQQLAQQIPQLLPETIHTDLRSAYFLPDEAIVRNPRHLQALTAGCLKRGVKITEQTEAIRFKLSGNQAVSLETNQGEIQAGMFCLAAGSWSQQISDLLYESIGDKTFIKTPEIEPIRGQILLYQTGQRLLPYPINEGPRYIIPRQDGHLLIGSTVEEVGFDQSTTTEAFDELREFACSLLPCLNELEPQRIWAGLRPASLDRLPYIGQVPGTSNVFMSSGHYRSGLHLSPGSAVTLGRVMRGLDPEFDLEPFRLDRG